MRTLVLGGIRSGKSQWAEAAIAGAVGTPDAVVRYLATGPHADSDPAWSARIDRHRERRPAHWHTVENPDLATELRAHRTTAALIDDIGGWLTATMDQRDAWNGGSVTADIDDLLSAIDDFDAPLVLVSPEVGLSVVPATRSGRRFADELGTLNQRLAAGCDHVVLVVAGLAVWIKPRQEP